MAILTIQRSYLNKLKKEFKSEKERDRDFLEWYMRNYGLGMRAGMKFRIIKNKKLEKVI